MKLKNWRIVTWNCNGALRKKYQFLSKLDADIYVVQECENPLECIHSEYADWTQNHLWIGDRKHKGLGIFAKPEIDLSLLDWSNEYESAPVKHFISCKVDSKFDLVAVWTHYNNSPTFGYIGQFWKYFQLHKDKLKNCLLLGDFNSNAIWDKPKRQWNHSEVVKELAQLDIESCYHCLTHESQGKETSPTFFLQKNISKPYHIDYVFASSFFRKNLKNVVIGDVETWLPLSDHLPVTCDFTI